MHRRAHGLGAAPEEESRYAAAPSSRTHGTPLELIQVVVIDLPRMLSEVVTEILSDAPDILVSATLPENGGSPDVAVVGGADAARAGELLDRFPRMKVLAVDDEGRNAVFYELRPHQVELGEISPDALLAAIRTVERAPR